MICRVLLMPSWMIHHHSMDGTAFLSQYHMFCIVYKTGINWVVPQLIRQYIYSFPLTGDRFHHTTNCCLIIVRSQAICTVFTLTHNKLVNENTIVPASDNNDPAIQANNTLFFVSASTHLSTDLIPTTVPLEYDNESLVDQWSLATEEKATERGVANEWSSASDEDRDPLNRIVSE